MRLLPRIASGDTASLIDDSTLDEGGLDSLLWMDGGVELIECELVKRSVLFFIEPEA
jgi:hypothetical protein